MRIPNDFRTIVGNGGTLIPGSDSGTVDGPNAQLPLPIPQFYFLAQRFSEGFPVTIAPNGYISFNRSLASGSVSAPFLNYLTGTTLAYANKIIAAFWGNVQPAGTPGGGIYWKTEMGDGQQVLVVEWRVRSLDTPGAPPGNFQVRLFELGAIEIYYGPTALQLQTPGPGVTGHGAAVGIKNYGQQVGDPRDTRISDPSDNEKFLLMLNAAQVPDTSAITRVRTLDIPGSPFSPELRADLSSYVSPQQLYRPSPYFHYTFPDSVGQPIGYRIKPMDYEMGAETTYVTRNGLPSSEPAVFTPNDLPKISARFRNFGTIGIQKVPVAADLYRKGALLGTIHDTVKYIGPKDTISFTFATPISPNVANTSDVYYVRTRIELSDDPDPGNDTAQTRFTMRGTTDLMLNRILFPGTAPTGSYRVGAPIPVGLEVVDVGAEAIKSFSVRYTIVDDKGTVMADVTAPIQQDLSVFKPETLLVQTWTPTQPGRYYIDASVSLKGDDVPGNDTLRFADSRGQQFTVTTLRDVLIAPFPLYEHEPMQKSYPLGDSIPIEGVVLITGAGAGLGQRPDVTAQIKDAGGAVVYTRTADFATSDGYIRVRLPSFAPQSPGSYCLTMSVSSDNDNNPDNNRQTWCFDVTGTQTGVESDERMNGLSLTVRPNPATDAVVVEYRTPNQEKAEIALYDMIGRELPIEAEETGQGTIVLSVGDLPAGFYTVRLRTASGTALGRSLHIVR
jgi:hypothetical protein